MAIITDTGMATTMATGTVITMGFMATVTMEMGFTETVMVTTATVMVTTLEEQMVIVEVTMDIEVTSALEAVRVPLTTATH